MLESYNVTFIWCAYSLMLLLFFSFFFFWFWFEWLVGWVCVWGWGWGWHLRGQPRHKVLSSLIKILSSWLYRVLGVMSCGLQIKGRQKHTTVASCSQQAHPLEVIDLACATNCRLTCVLQACTHTLHLPPTYPYSFSVVPLSIPPPPPAQKKPPKNQQQQNSGTWDFTLIFIRVYRKQSWSSEKTRWFQNRCRLETCWHCVCLLVLRCKTVANGPKYFVSQKKK